MPPRDSGLYFPWWSLVLLILFVGGAAFAIVFAFSELSEPQTPGDQGAIFMVITSQPTLSQDFSASDPGGLWPTAIPLAYPTATVPLPTPIPSPSLPPGDLTVGMQVQVVGVGTSGLNVRTSAGYTGTPRFLAYDDDRFAIIGGPQTADGLEWWQIEDPNDPSRIGWAARNYLTILP